MNLIQKIKNKFDEKIYSYVKSKTNLYNKLCEEIEKQITRYAKLSYSQFGEDLLIDTLIDYENERDCFYVDIGAHHPFRFSNTYYFYKKGWHGINIDASPDSIYFFNQYRQRDINLEVCISDKEEEVDFYIFEEPALNTFDKKLSEERRINSKLKEVKKIKCSTINSILEKYLPKNKNITFLSIDIEGMDIKVLKTLDFKKYIIKIIIMEKNYDNNENEYVKEFLKNIGYNLVIETQMSYFFKA